MLLALYLQTQHQPHPRLLSPGSGVLSTRYGWPSPPPNIRGLGLGFGNTNYGGGGSMASTPSTEDGCDDSGTAGAGPESHLIRHIDRNILACQICLKRYKTPKVLPCLHTFCLRCLCIYLPPESLTLTCPLCGQQSILPFKGLRGLQPNHFIVHLIDVIKDDNGERSTAANTTLNSCCEEDEEGDNTTAEDEDYSELDASISLSYHCDQQPTSIEQPESGVFSLPPYELCRTFFCSFHVGQPFKLFCASCETAICIDCSRAEHRGHKVENMADAVDSEKEALKDLVSKAKEQVPELRAALENIESTSSQLSAKEADLRNEINASFDQLRNLVEQKRSEMLQQLQRCHAEKQRTLGRQRDELESSLAEIYTNCEFVEKSLDHATDTEVLLVKKQVGERMAEYGDIKVVAEPAENLHLVYQSGKVSNFEKYLNSWCAVRTSSALPSQTCAFGEGIKHCNVGRPVTVTVTPRDWQGKIVMGPEVEYFFCELVPLNLVPRASGRPIELTTELTDLEDGSYELNYAVPVEGQYQLAVKLFDTHISGSPFTLAATPMPMHTHPHKKTSTVSLHSSSTARKRGVIGRKTSAAANFAYHRPSSVKSFSDTQCSRINPIEDDLLLRMGSRGRGKGEFSNPQGVAIALNGRILVADSNNQCIQSFLPTGEIRARFGVRGRSPGQMQRPTGLCVLENGNVAVADYDNKWVSIFDPTGKFVSKIGSGKLLGPKGIAVNKAGHLVVVDNKASCVFIFQQNGKLVLKFGARGAEDHNFAGPHYVAINSQGNIVISDFHNHSIKVFDSEGNFLFCFGSNGEGNGQFNAPTGIAIDAQDNILVADWGNSRIQIFDSQGSFLAFVNTLACPLYGPQGMGLTKDGNIVVADSGNHCLKLYRYLQ